MDSSIPLKAVKILDFIASKEAPKGYNTVYGNRKMPKLLTKMTFDEVVNDGLRRTREYGSSACGRYQFMRDTLDAPKTLADIKGEMGLTGSELFSPDLQDRMGYHLLKRRGYLKFEKGTLSVTGFALNLAKEWASFPVLKDVQGAHRKITRGQSFYAGDGLNKALVSADEVEKFLTNLSAVAAPQTASTPSVEESIAKPNRPSIGGFLASLWAKLHPPAAVVPASDVKGDPTVFSIQKQLKDKGYYLNGFLDGIDGPKYRDAIAASRKDNGLGDGPADAAFITALPTFGMRPVANERAKADFAVVKAHAPDLALPVGTMWKVGAGLLGLGGADAANQGGLLDTIKTAGDNANDVLGTVQSAFGTIAGIVQFVVEHRQWIYIAFGLYLLFRAASFALNLIIRIRQAFF